MVESSSPSPPQTAAPPTQVNVAPQTITTGGNHACGIDASGSAWCWGSNLSGRLGNGTLVASTSPEYAPVRVAGGHSFTAIDAGITHTCAIDDDGRAWCWGQDYYGQLGDGGRDSQAAPFAVAGGHTFTGIAAGLGHTCAVDTDGVVWCWGSDDNGRLGIGDPVNVDTRVPVAVDSPTRFVSVTASDLQTCGLDTDQRAWCWGSGEDGRLGTWDTQPQFRPAQVSGDLTFASLTAGDKHTCGLTGDGQAWCWGFTTDGQLGNGVIRAATSTQGEPVAVAGGHTWTALSAGSNHTCGIAADGPEAGWAWCWGDGAVGKIGDGDPDGANRLEPVTVSGGRNFTAISAGQWFTCAVDVSGTAWCWGYGEAGKLGNGDPEERNRDTPALVVGDATFRVS